MKDSSSSIDLDEIVEEFTEQCRSGRRSSVENNAERYPQFAEEILDLFPTLLTMEQAVPESDDEFERIQDGQLEGFANEEPCPERLDDYRIVREIGRGGMGVMYEAEQGC